MTVLFSRQKIPQNDCFFLKTKKTPKRLFCPEDKKYPKTTCNFGGDFSKKKKQYLFLLGGWLSHKVFQKN
jgi:hypothetical protein